MEIVSTTPKDTETFARLLGELAQPGDVLILTGDLGAGKTTLTKGIALGLGIEQLIKSPTYTIIREYQSGRLPLYHMDVYRVGQGAEDLGLEEYFEGDGLSVVEWGDLLQEAVPDTYLNVTVAKEDQFTEKRRIQLKAVGTVAQKRLAEIEAAWRKFSE
jgi:tRNA threonylcarbamoyladenosine biosynthesis protein TsaE